MRQRPTYSIPYSHILSMSIRQFSTYKEDSEISRINRHELSIEQASADMRTIFTLAEQTKQATDGYFDIARNGIYDPSGIVKGWAIYHAAEIVSQHGYTKASMLMLGAIFRSPAATARANRGAWAFATPSTCTRS